MAIEHKRLVTLTAITSSAAAVFTNPASTRTYMKVIYLHNHSDDSQDVQLWLVPSGQSASDTYQFFRRTLAPHESYQIEFGGGGLILESTSETVQAKAGVSSKVNLWATGASLAT